METYDDVALGVECAWPAFVDGATTPVPLMPQPEHSEERPFHSIPTTA